MKYAAQLCSDGMESADPPQVALMVALLGTTGAISERIEFDPTTVKIQLDFKDGHHLHGWLVATEGSEDSDPKPSCSM